MRTIRVGVGSKAGGGEMTDEVESRHGTRVRKDEKVMGKGKPTGRFGNLYCTGVTFVRKRFLWRRSVKTGPVLHLVQVSIFDL